MFPCPRPSLFGAEHEAPSSVNIGCVTCTEAVNAGKGWAFSPGKNRVERGGVLTSTLYCTLVANKPKASTEVEKGLLCDHEFTLRN